MNAHIVGLGGILTEKIKNNESEPAYVEYEFVGECKMDESKFRVLIDVLRVLEKNSTPEIVESVMQIIDHYENDLTMEQKTRVLKEFLGFKKREDDKRKKFEEEQTKQKMQQFMKTF